MVVSPIFNGIIPIFNRKYIFKLGLFSIAMLVYQRVDWVGPLPISSGIHEGLGWNPPSKKMCFVVLVVTKKLGRGTTKHIESTRMFWEMLQIDLF